MPLTLREFLKQTKKRDPNEDVAALLQRIESVKGEKGDPGKDGKDGRDGKDGKDGRDGIDGQDGKAGQPGLDGAQGEPGQNGKDGKDGRDGKDGSPDTAEEIRNKLASLKDDERLDASAIKNLPKSSILSVGSSHKAYYKVIYPSQIIGVIDGANTAFYLPEAPKRVEELELLLDNTIQEPTQNFTLTGNRIDYTFAPQVGQRHWARIFRP